MVYDEPIDGKAARRKAQRKIDRMPQERKTVAKVNRKKTTAPQGRLSEKAMPKSSELAERVHKAQERTDKIEKSLPLPKRSLWEKR